MKDDLDYIELSRQGWIPGPEEDLGAFLKRVAFCRALKERLSSSYKQPVFEAGSQEAFASGLKISDDLYGISPSWVPVIFSKEHLAPWHAGCAWIFEENRDEAKGALMQLHPAFAKKQKLFFLYSREELVAHEMGHVGRMAFEEPIFEEFFCWRSSPYPFRQFFGPIVKAPWESALFMGTLAITTFIQLFAAYENVMETTLWLFLLPFLLFLIGLIRLLVRHGQLKRCMAQLEKVLGDKTKAWQVAYRLKDKEIIAISAMSQNRLIQYLSEKKAESPRWQSIHESFFLS